MKTLRHPAALAGASWHARDRLAAARRRELREACLAHMATYGPDLTAAKAGGFPHAPLSVVEQARLRAARKIGAIE